MGNLSLPTIAQGQLSMYQTSNDADAALEQAITEITSVDLSTGDGSLTGLQVARAIFFNCTGNSVTRALTLPAAKRLFAVMASGSAAVTLTCGTTTISIGSGSAGVFYTDGTANGLYPLTSPGSGLGAIAANSLIGNNTGSSAAPGALSVSQVKTLLAIAAGDVSGLAAVATSGSAADLATGTLNNSRLSGVELTANKGANNGYAPLDSSGLVPTANLPAGITGGLNFKGVWNASTNTPTLASGTGTAGDFYIASVAGTTTLDGISSWGAGDIAVFEASAWHKIVGATGAVLSVAGKTGAVTLAVGDVSGAAPLASPTFTGTPAVPTATSGTSTTQAASTAFVQTALAAVGAGGTAGGDLAGTYPNPTIAANAVSNAKAAQMATHTVKGNNTGGTANASDLTVAQLKTLLAIAAADVSGLAASATTDATNAGNITSGALAAARLAAIRYDIATYFPGVPIASQKLLRYVAARAITIPSSATGSQCSAGTAATASYTMTITKNGTSVGTIVVSGVGTTGAFTVAAPILLAAGDVLMIAGAATPDATIADIAITLAATA